MGSASATALAGKSNIVISLEHKKGIDLSTILDELKISCGVDWTFGTGANQANCLFHDSRSTDNTGETIDVYEGGVEKNAFGDALTMEAIKLLYVKNTHATLTLEVLGTATTAIGICADPSDMKLTVKSRKRVIRGVLVDDSKVNEKLAWRLRWDFCIVDWREVSLDGQQLECTTDNKVKMMNVTDFVKFVVDSLETLVETNKALDEARLKNSENSSNGNTESQTALSA